MNHRHLHPALSMLLRSAADRAGASAPPRGARVAPLPPRGGRRRHLRLVVGRRSPSPAWKPGEDGGFSLLELLVVVAILGILVAAALPRFAEFRAAAYDSRSQQDLRNLAAADGDGHGDDGRRFGQAAKPVQGTLGGVA
ncbi:MAG: type IV pilin protein, partial [Candidatus Binatia bacterium]